MSVGIKLTQQEFLGRVKAVHGDRYDLSEAEYTTFHSTVKVRCITHGWFYPRANVLMDGRGCRKCANIAVSVKKASTAAEFIRKAVGVHGDKYDYSKVVYKNSSTPVEILCKHHNSFWQSPANHLYGKECAKCAATKQLETKRRNYSEKFLRKAAEIHGDKYDYSESVYTLSKSPIDIICKTHGKFSMVAGQHLSGSGCQECAEAGYKTTLPGYLYVLSDGCDLTKVGITNNPPQERCRLIVWDSMKNFKVLKGYLFSDGSFPKHLEKVLLKELKSKYKQPSEKFDGYTECFYDVDQAALLNLIDSLIKEHNSSNLASQEA